MSALDRLVGKLDAAGSKVRRTGTTTMAQCPAHEDKNPSLSLRQIEGQALVYCHAGCDTADVLAALGATAADLYDEPAGASYSYADAAGNPTRVVLRTPDKRFRQTGQTKGATSLYRLPAVVAAVDQGQTVYLVEGEKDVHAIESVGGVATTAPMGAGNWHRVDATPLRGATVVAVVDQDEAGSRWAGQVRESLAGKARSVRFVRAAAGKDAADHIAAGHGLDELDELDLTEPPGLGVVTMADVQPERVRWLWPGRLPAGKIVVLDGDPATGKSTLTTYLAARVSTGTPWPDGAACEAGDVLVLSAEDGLADTIVPRLLAAGADTKRVHALTDVPVRTDDGDVRTVPPSLPRDIGLVRGIVDQRGITLVVVDVLMAYLDGRTDSHRDQDVRGVLHQLATMAEQTGCTVVLVRHLNKAGGSNALYRGGGSIGIVGAARAAFLVARDPEDADRRIFAVTKMNLGPEPPSLAYKLVSDPSGCARVEWEPGPVEHTAASLLSVVTDDERTERDEAVEWLLSYLKEHGGSAPARDIFKAGRADAIGERRLQRARSTARVESKRAGFGEGSVWSVRDTIPAIRDSHDRAHGAVVNVVNGVANGEAAPEPGPPGTLWDDPPGDPLDPGRGAMTAGTDPPEIAGKSRARRADALSDHRGPPRRPAAPDAARPDPDPPGRTCAGCGTPVPRQWVRCTRCNTTYVAELWAAARADVDAERGA